ncbi:hypothetical protein GCM10010448_67980 [Streptomyces glomeratus]|uniref:Uncharacterized protein n=1 Tax=Streptomyces glomeratus TaxID=284452 RepID=A0ABP6M7M3_9ACTN
MLILAVATGESGANPELSRNGVLACIRTPVQSEDLPAARPAVRSGRLETSGPRGVGRWTRRRARSWLPPALRKAPAPSEGESPT